MTDAPRMPDRKREREEVPIVNGPQPRRRMTRREIWNLMAVAAAGWVIVFALARIWWRIYRAVSP